MSKVLSWLNTNAGATALFTGALQAIASLILVRVTWRNVKLTRQMVRAASQQIGQREREFTIQETPILELAPMIGVPPKHVEYSALTVSGLRLSDNEVHRLVNLGHGTVWIRDCWALAQDESGLQVAKHLSEFGPANILLKSGDVHELDLRLFADFQPGPPDAPSPYVTLTFYKKVTLVLDFLYSAGGGSFEWAFEIEQDESMAQIKVRRVQLG